MTTKTGYSRRVSLFERIALVAAEASPPGANQLIVEGSGVFDEEGWRTAVERASQANPGVRLVKRNSWSGLRWADSGETPPVRVVDGGRWSGNGLEDASFLLQPFDPEKGPACEVLLIRGDPLRAAFRTLHAVTDLTGTMLWADDVFRALRGEPTLGSNSELTDLGLLRSLKGVKPRTAVGHESGRRFRAPTGGTSDERPGMVFRRLRIKAAGSNLPARLAFIIAGHARALGGGDARFAISVDLRRRAPGLMSTANLVRDIYVDVDLHSTVREIADVLRAQLDAAQESLSLPIEVPLQHAPKALIRGFARLSKRRRRGGEYRVTGLLANMGKVSLDRFRGGGFVPQGVFAVPPGHPAYPLFLAAFGYGDMLDIGFSAPQGLADEGRLDRLVEAVRLGLQEKDNKHTVS